MDTGQRLPTSINPRYVILRYFSRRHVLVCHFALDYFVVVKFVERGLKLYVLDFLGYFAVETLQKNICHVRRCTEDE